MTIPECLDIITGQKDLADQLHALILENLRLRLALKEISQRGPGPDREISSVLRLRLKMTQRIARTALDS